MKVFKWAGSWLRLDGIWGCYQRCFRSWSGCCQQRLFQQLGLHPELFLCSHHPHHYRYKLNYPWLICCDWTCFDQVMAILRPRRFTEDFSVCCLALSAFPSCCPSWLMSEAFLPGFFNWAGTRTRHDWPCWRENFTSSVLGQSKHTAINNWTKLDWSRHCQAKCRLT